MAESWLFIVDVQRGFVNQWTEDIPGKVTSLQDRFDRVVVTRFINPEGSFYRRLMHWTRFAPGSDDVALAFDPQPKAYILDKPQYSCLTPEVEALLDQHPLDRIHLCGIATDNCILKTAVDLFERGVVPVVLADYCGSHGGPDCHQAGLLLLRRFIGAEQVVNGVPDSM